MNAGDLYGVKVVYRYEVDGEVFYEETVVRLRADSFDDAIDRAAEWAWNRVDDEHVNPEGAKVTETVCDAFQCYQVFEDGEEVEETFSRILKNKTGLPEPAFMDVLTDSLSRDEMRPIRWYADPGEA